MENNNTPSELEALKQQFPGLTMGETSGIGGESISPDLAKPKGQPTKSPEREVYSKVYSDSTVGEVLGMGKKTTQSNRKDNTKKDFFGETIARQAGIAASSAVMGVNAARSQGKMEQVIEKGLEDGKITEEQAKEFRAQLVEQRGQRTEEIISQGSREPSAREGFGDVLRTGALVGSTVAGAPATAISAVGKALPLAMQGTAWGKAASVVLGGVGAEVPMAIGEKIRTGDNSEAALTLAMGPLAEFGGAQLAKPFKILESKAKLLFPQGRMAEAGGALADSMKKARKSTVEFLQLNTKELAESIRKGELPDVISAFINNVIPVETREQLNTVLKTKANRLMGKREQIFNKYNVQFTDNTWLDEAVDYIAELKGNKAFITEKGARNKIDELYKQLEEYNATDYDVHSLNKVKMDAAEKVADLYQAVKTGADVTASASKGLYERIAKGAREAVEGVHPDIKEINKEYAAIGMARELNAFQAAIAEGTATPGFLQQWGRSAATMFASQGYQAIEVSRLMMGASKANAKKTTNKIFNLGREIAKQKEKLAGFADSGVNTSKSLDKAAKFIPDTAKKVISTGIKTSAEGN